MTSRFGWLDADDEQRRTMMELIALFRDQGTVDEIGIGTIRDTIANALFPGLSVLQTRLRYVLFIPWLVTEVARSATSSAGAVEALRRRETQLIESLLTGTSGLAEADGAGIIGRRARANLRNMPSSVFWGALGVWGIRTWDEGVEGHLRRSIGLRALERSRPATDEADAREHLDLSGFAAGLPPRPEGLLTTTDFRLSAGEADFLAHRIRLSTAGSLLGWLVDQPVVSSAAHVWELAHLRSAPGPMVELVDHGRRLAIVMDGATLLYNLILAEETTNTELADGYREALAAWSAELHGPDVIDGWDAPGFWAALARHNGRITGPTRAFVDQWRGLVSRAPDVAESAACRDLLARRERQIKGARARIGNRSALERWSGASGIGRLGYRWGTAQRLLTDLHPALEVASART